MAEAKNPKIIEFVAENFKKIRVVEIRPDGNLVKITGKNGQGKTSVLDALWFLLKGQTALPAKAVRKGAEKLRVHADFGTFTVTRTMSEGGAPTLNLEMAKGSTRDTTPQKFLDQLMNTLTFDPLEFVRMHTADQVKMLQQVAGVDDAKVKELTAANDLDYETRRDFNRAQKQLETLAEGITVADGLPKDPVDERAILIRLEQAGERNKRAQDIFKAKQDLHAVWQRAMNTLKDNERFIAEQDEKVQELERQLVTLRNNRQAAIDVRDSLAIAAGEALVAHDEAPSGELIDVTAITMELQEAQNTNRAIAQRSRYEDLARQAKEKASEGQKLTRAMESREEQKRELLAAAKIPVDGLVFDDRQVLYKGLPLENLGEAEQIRISVQIGMAANPKLRVLSIRHGEALDEDGMKILAKMAKDNDFQIWMSAVDSSGKVGIVLEDGMVVARNEE